MDDDCHQTSTLSTQQLLADRVRQRYARCREALETRTVEEPAIALTTRASLHLVAIIGDKADEPAQAHSASAAECFSALFSQAYSAARHAKGAAFPRKLDRARKRISA